MTTKEPSTPPAPIELTKTSILLIHVKTTFNGEHHWPEAPDEVSFLREVHSHVFHVEATIPVNHNDRELEYFIVKRVIDNLITFAHESYTTLTWSCERWAEYIGHELAKTYGRDLNVKVSEDGENGSTAYIILNDILLVDGVDLLNTGGLPSGGFRIIEDREV
jgi:hypothetical protein